MANQDNPQANPGLRPSAMTTRATSSSMATQGTESDQDQVETTDSSIPRQSESSYDASRREDLYT